VSDIKAANATNMVLLLPRTAVQRATCQELVPASFPATQSTPGMA